MIGGAVTEIGGQKKTGAMDPSCRLYLITPVSMDDLPAFAKTLDGVLSAGHVAALQIRLKGAPEEAIVAAVAALQPVARHHDVALILNDRADLADRLACDGVHIGQEDGPITRARRIMGEDRLVGVTCHGSRHLAMEAAESGADYVAFGAFFPTTTKDATAVADPEILTFWQEAMLVPCVAIGGVTAGNCRPLVAAGADFLAVSAGVWRHLEGAAAAVRAFAPEILEGLADRR